MALIHELTEEDLRDYVSESTIASQAGKGGAKSLRIRSTFTAEGKISSTLAIYRKEEKIDEFWGLPQAIEAYNKL